VQKLHPAVLELGLAYSSGSITGATARTIAMLVALKRVVAAYTTPEKQSLSRSLTSYINSCVGFLWDECRPACVPQRNSVKWLKGLIGTVRCTSDGRRDKYVMVRVRAWCGRHNSRHLLRLFCNASANMLHNMSKLTSVMWHSTRTNKNTLLPTTGV
jgi:translation initiation factor 2B subunit (eIF-2B alpha/beta/delta family)